jgi:single-strand DNA-binding protein
MGSVNKAILIGNLGRDAEMRFTQGGTPVATVSLATTERYTDRQGEKREDTQWHRVVIWGKTAESLHQYLTKGKQIFVEGRIQTREWTDKEGKPVKTTEIRADRITLLGGGGRREAEAEVGGTDATTDAEYTHARDVQPADDEVPFAWFLPFLLPASLLLTGGMLA